MIKTIEKINIKRMPFGALLSSKSFLVFLLYTLIAFIFTYPMIFRLNAFPYTGAEPLPPGSDIFIYLWDMWWFKQAMVNFANPFWTNYIFYPHGVSLVFSLANIIWCLMAVPLQPYLSLAAIYNLFFIFSLILSGMGAFWLIKYLTGSNWGGFIGGLIFAFAPYHFAHIGSMTVFSVQWIPFFMLFFIKIFEENNWPNAVLAAVFWSANWYSDLNYAVFTTVFAALVIMYYLIYNRQEAPLLNLRLKQLIIMAGTFIIITGPYLVLLLAALFSGSANISVPLHNSVSQSADVLSFFVPSFMHSVFGPLVKPFYDHITTYNGYRLGGYIETTTYVGFTTIFLAIFAIKHIGFQRLRLWIFMAIFFFILTLGPVLKIGGLVQIPAEWMHLDKIVQAIEPDIDPLAIEMMKKSAGIPLPYLIWHFTPFLSGAESAGRLNIMFVLAWSVLCGFGVKAIFEKLNKHKQRYFIAYIPSIACLLIVIFVLFEYASFPIKMIECPIPSFYEKLRENSGGYALIDLPILNSASEDDPRAHSNWRLLGGFNNSSSKHSMYNQTVHHKKVVNGMVCRLYKNIREFVDTTPVIRLLAYPEQINENTLAVDTMPLLEYKIKYIILHRNYLTEGELKKLTLFLGTKFNKVFDKQRIVAYQTY